MEGKKEEKPAPIHGCLSYGKNELFALSGTKSLLFSFGNHSEHIE